MYTRWTIACILITVIASAVGAESLFPKDEPTPMYADKKAVKAGDVLTVVIVESASSTSTASTNAKKDTQTEVSPGVGPLIKNIPGFEYSAGDSLKAQGSTTRASTFTARMTVTVKKVTDNGNFEIEGTRFVQTNSEKEEIKLTGTVRPQDVSPDNTVLSTAIADARITHTGSGPVGSRQKEGLVTRILRILF